jgi:hypothetical protein
VWVAHEVRELFGSEKMKRGCDVGKSLGIEELLDLWPKVSDGW